MRCRSSASAVPEKKTKNQPSNVRKQGIEMTSVMAAHLVLKRVPPDVVMLPPDVFDSYTLFEWPST